MRRLYSTFAGSWPGLGLLVMRLVVGSVLLFGVGLKRRNDPPLPTIVTSAPLAGSGLLLIAGLWTPLAGSVVVVIEIWDIMTMKQDALVGLLAEPLLALWRC